VKKRIESWPVLRQLAARDVYGLGRPAASQATRDLTGRTARADSIARSICPYCAVGCGQLVYVEDGEITQIEGDPDSPISRGRLCPKGAASRQFVTGPSR
jgi:formate dehydrogenase major subunit